MSTTELLELIPDMRLRYLVAAAIDYANQHREEFGIAYGTRSLEALDLLELPKT